VTEEGIEEERKVLGIEVGERYCDDGAVDFTSVGVPELDALGSFGCWFGSGDLFGVDESGGDLLALGGGRENSRHSEIRGTFLVESMLL
jgi:hypothetical protein